MPDGEALRRVDDQRFVDLNTKVEGVERKVDHVERTVREIRDMLISEPEASPLGRQLLQRSRDNRDDIDKIDVRVGVLEDWRNQAVGGWRVITGFSLILGTIGAFFGLVSYFGHHL